MISTLHIVDQIRENIKFSYENPDIINKSNIKTVKTVKTVKTIKNDKNNIKFNKNRGNYELGKFKSRMKSHEAKRNLNKDPTINIKPMVLINDFSEIDNLDKGKPWKRLDNWMRKKCLIEYAKRNNLNKQHTDIILNLFESGEFKLTSEVQYNAIDGKIIKLNSSKLNILLS